MTEFKMRRTRAWSIDNDADPYRYDALFELRDGGVTQIGVDFAEINDAAARIKIQRFVDRNFDIVRALPACLQLYGSGDIV